MELKSREEFERLKSLPMFKAVIVSDSMEPKIRVGEKIAIMVGDRELQRFDLIVFWMEGKLVCHYVWAMNRMITPFLIQTRNLKYLFKDTPISWDDYLGKVISHRLSGRDKFMIWLRLKLAGRR